MTILGDLLGNLRSGFRAERDVTDERFWSSEGLVSMAGSGVVVNRAQALHVSCCFHGVRLIAETLGSLPRKVYREEISADGDLVRKRQDRNHYLSRVIRRQANPWQTAQEFVETMTAWAILHGKAYAKINRAGAPVSELVPIDPSLVVEEKLENGRLRYRVQGLERPLVEEEVFTIRGMGLSLHLGEPLIALARETIGLWLAHEKFKTTYFAQGATPGLWLKTPKKLSTEVYNRLKESAASRYAGPQNWHKVQIAEEGLEPFPIGFDAKASQLSESKEEIVAEWARWLNIPLHMMRSTMQTTTYASAEQFAGEFVDYNLRPWCVRWEQSFDRDLIAEDDVYVEHVMEGLLRGKTLERAQADQIYVNIGVKTRNEVRRQENMNPLPGLDEPLTPLNMERTGATTTTETDDDEPPRRRRRSDDEEQAAVPRRLALIVRNVARGLARQETAQLAAYATKLAGKPEAWSDWLATFYETFTATVATRLELEPSVARGYAMSHRDQLQSVGLGGLPPIWEAQAADELCRLATETTATTEEEAVHE